MLRMYWKTDDVIVWSFEGAWDIDDLLGAFDHQLALNRNNSTRAIIIDFSESTNRPSNIIHNFPAISEKTQMLAQEQNGISTVAFVGQKEGDARYINMLLRIFSQIAPGDYRAYDSVDAALESEALGG